MLDDCTQAWSVADKQYKYFKHTRFAKKVITIKSETQISKKTRKVKAGDLLYWDSDNDKEIDHASIVTSNAKEKGKKVLRYGGHSNARNNDIVKVHYDENNVLKVIRLKDKFTIPYNS